MSRYDVDSMVLISQIQTYMASMSMLFARNFINISQLIQTLLQSQERDDDIHMFFLANYSRCAT
jgi:hypothetical protein